MKKFFKQIPAMKSKTLSHNLKKLHKLLTDIGSGCYMKKTKRLPTIRKNTK